MSQAKKKLRMAVIARRDAIDAHERKERSRTVCAQLIRALDTLDKPEPMIALYAYMGSEVQLDALIETARSRSWGLCFPAMLVASEDEAPMAFFQVGAQAALEHPAFLGNQLKRYTSTELANRFPLVNPADIDAAIVPLVAFDDRNMRMGYGGGNYDRYLPRLRTDALVIGAAFVEQHVENIPVEPHDQPLPQIAQA